PDGSPAGPKIWQIGPRLNRSTSSPRTTSSWSCAARTNKPRMSSNSASDATSPWRRLRRSWMFRFRRLNGSGPTGEPACIGSPAAGWTVTDPASTFEWFAVLSAQPSAAWPALLATIPEPVKRRKVETLLEDGRAASRDDFLRPPAPDATADPGPPPDGVP